MMLSAESRADLDDLNWGLQHMGQVIVGMQASQAQSMERSSELARETMRMAVAPELRGTALPESEADVGRQSETPPTLPPRRPEWHKKVLNHEGGHKKESLR